MQIQLKETIDKLWQMYWMYGISNALDFLRQTSYLLLLHKLEQLEAEKKISIYKSSTECCRWSKLIQMEDAPAFEVVTKVMPDFLRSLDQEKILPYPLYLHDAAVKIPTPHSLQAILGVLKKVLTLLDQELTANPDVEGEMYEHMLSKLTECGILAVFRTPRHLVAMMCKLLDIRSNDFVCDPACGMGGFLIAAADEARSKGSGGTPTLCGMDSDLTSSQLSTLNLLYHRIDQPSITHADSLCNPAFCEEQYSKVLCNPPFRSDTMEPPIHLKGLTGYTTNTQPLFLALYLRLLRHGGRCACIVPEGTLFQRQKAFRKIREELVEQHKLEAVISIPRGVFKPYAGCSAAVLVFTKTGIGGTENVWFYDMCADGYSLDNKRKPVPENDIPDILARFGNIQEKKRDRSEQSFLVPRTEIAADDYRLDYRSYACEPLGEIHFEDPKIHLRRLTELDSEVSADLEKIRKILMEEK